MPFVFASGAEFTDSEKSGAARINEIFSIARRNVCISYLLLWNLVFFSWTINVNISFVGFVILFHLSK